jgi:hypothetical protein
MTPLEQGKDNMSITHGCLLSIQLMAGRERVGGKAKSLRK